MDSAFETRTARIGRIAARITTIVLALAAVGVKLSIDKALAEFAEAQRRLPPR